VSAGPKYGRQHASAFALLRKKGQRMLVCVPSPQYDPLTPDTAGTLWLSVEASGVTLPRSSNLVRTFDSSEKRDTHRPASERFVLLAIDPKSATQQLIAVGSILATAEGYYTVKGVTVLNPDGLTNILYTLGCTTDVEVPVDTLPTL
jgi:hypothetical protein